MNNHKFIGSAADVVAEPAGWGGAETLQGDGASVPGVQVVLLPAPAGRTAPRVASLPMQTRELRVKRLVDIVVSAVVLAAGVPVWLALALLVRLTSRGPVIYKQERVGEQNRVFTIYKFRTMRDGAEDETGPVWARENDPRLTAAGRRLRKWRLDEVPQFWNVLRGEMTLVGPRPERPYFVAWLAREVPRYDQRHRVKPGITGWAQIRRAYDTCLEDVRCKITYDLFYIEHMSLRMDGMILLHTLRTWLSGQGR